MLIDNFVAKFSEIENRIKAKYGRIVHTSVERYLLPEESFLSLTIAPLNRRTEDDYGIVIGLTDVKKAGILTIDLCNGEGTILFEKEFKYSPQTISIIIDVAKSELKSVEQEALNRLSKYF